MKSDSNEENRGKAKNRIVEVDKDVNIMISKNASNNESKVSNKDRVFATPNYRTSLFELFWNNIKEIDIEDNDSTSKVDNRGLDNLGSIVDQLLLNMRNNNNESMDIRGSNRIYDDGCCERSRTISDEIVNLIDFNKVDWMSKGKLQNTFDVFLESDLIDFEYIEKEIVKSDKVKAEMIEADKEMFQ
ncbi:hypothetical protein C2G38_2031701 [Gigaspora rosea]|uniref:Uncharacterized protein n=1 Tax=Gigaspora rosea TaxID=44941 RepID=A0A397VSE4_9GLOM|nr:hypothetical protein C2G38_2031701 [Gigaspora rosea]